MELKKEVAKKEKKRNAMHRENGELFLLQLPAIVYVFIFCYLPMVGLIIAFKDYKFDLGIFGSKWNGINNFKYLFGSQTFYTLVRNTIGYNFASIFIGMAVSAILALMLEVLTSKIAIKIYQSSMFLPVFLSWVVVSYISYALFAVDTGMINNILKHFGHDGISFYSEIKYWPFILIFFGVWKGFGQTTLIYYGTLLSVDQEIIEAATLDGCGYIKKIIYIMLPHLKQTMIMMFILSIGGIFRSDFGLFFYLPKDTGVLYGVTDVLDTYIMRSLRFSANVGMSSAAGFLQSVVGFITVVTVNKIVNKMDSESAIY